MRYTQIGAHCARRASYILHSNFILIPALFFRSLASLRARSLMMRRTRCTWVLDCSYQISAFLIIIFSQPRTRITRLPTSQTVSLMSVSSGTLPERCATLRGLLSPDLLLRSARHFIGNLAIGARRLARYRPCRSPESKISDAVALRSGFILQSAWTPSRIFYDAGSFLSL